MAATAVRRVCVVGAGPAGIIATAALSQAGHSVTWVDSARAFRECGRLGKFHNVHANTKVELMAAWFEDGVLGRAIAGDAASEAAVAQIRASAVPPPYPDYGDPNEGLCMLGVVVDALTAISIRLQASPTVAVVHGSVAAADLTAAASVDRRWSVRLASGAVAIDAAAAVVMAAGAVQAPLPAYCAALAAGGDAARPRVVDGEVAVDAKQLAAAVAPGERVALLGTSHSAALVAMHLKNMGWDASGLTVFSPTPARQALWIPPGQYHFSATGLKGIASAFFADEVRTAPDTSPLLQHRRPSELEDPAVLDSFDVVIPTIGYRTAALPAISMEGQAVDMHPTARDAASTQLMPRAAVLTAPTDIFRPAQKVGAGAGVVPGLYGLGIGYPDYFQRPVAPGERSAIGFGGEPDGNHGFHDENFVGFNAMILRAAAIADALGHA